MNNNITVKTLEMTRRIRDANYEKLSGKTRHERITFYREKAQRLYSKVGEPTRKESRNFIAS